MAGPIRLVADAEPALTRDGRRIEVGCNAANLEDAQRAAAAGADGIGLLRSEFLFLGSERLPTEAQQVRSLSRRRRIRRLACAGYGCNCFGGRSC